MTTRASALAPETARSFTVPFTASSPMEPPGKLSGLTTKLSVVIATFVPSMSTCAASPSGPGAHAKKQGSKKAFDQLAAGFASGSVRHLDLRIAEPDGRGFGNCERRRSAQAIELRLTIAALRCS